jgi:GntR family transcriptional regulator
MHRQLAQKLRNAIALGTYKPGDRLPAEPELAERHGVSRITARQAVLQLARERLVVRRQGKGTFVAEPPVHHDLLDPHGIYDELVARGVDPRTEVLEYELRAPPPEVNERLRSGGRKAVHWKRLYLRRGEPFAVSWVYLAPALSSVTREQVEQHSTYQLFENVLDVKVSHADLSVRAAAPTPALRKQLRLRPGVPVIALERVSYDAAGAPLEYTLYWANAESYEFVLRLRGKIPISSSFQGIK